MCRERELNPRPPDEFPNAIPFSYLATNQSITVHYLYHRYNDILVIGADGISVETLTAVAVVTN